MTNYRNKALLFVTLIHSLVNMPLHAQGLNNRAWAPAQSNRASIAALMKQVEDNNGQTSNSSALLATGSSVTQLVCGSSTSGAPPAHSNAQANSSCIILNNSDGMLNINQDSVGDQNSDVETIMTTETTQNQESSLDDILTALSGSSE